jgi:hypothetical protein
VESQGKVSLIGAARGVASSLRFWWALIFIAALTALGLLLPSSDPWWLLSGAAAMLAWGYELSVSRGVFDGEPVLPPLAEWTPMVRRALSLTLVLLPPGILLLIVLVIAIAGVNVWTARPHVLIPILSALMFTPLFFVVSAQYIAFDRLRDGFRYRQAWRRFRSHSRVGSRVIGYLLLGEAFYMLANSALAQLGLARVGAAVVVAVLYAPVLLLGAHLQGQYVAAAYAAERARDSV